MSLSDGVFAIALTLLVLSLEIPTDLDAGQLGAELAAISPMMIAFAVSVGIIALFWLSHHELFSEVQQVDYRLMWMNFAYLSLVVLIPFVQRVQGDFPFEPLSYVIYGLVLALLNFVDLAMHHYAYRARLLHRHWNDQRYRTEMNRGIALTGVFLLSIPLAFLLVSWTILIWLLALPIDFLVRYYSQRVVLPPP